MSHSTPRRHSNKKIQVPLGAKFGRWTVLCDGEGKKWICLCDCGTIRAVDAHTVRKGISISCGCYKIERTRKRSAKDIAGTRFGRLVAVQPTKRRAADGSVFWLCQCDCGLVKEISTNSLQNGTRSCGCWNGNHNFIDIQGQRFGRLLAIERVRVGDTYGWRCRCDCGKEKITSITSLRRGLTRSCGCLSIELSAERNTGQNHWNWKGGVVPWNQRYRGSPEYSEWRQAVRERDHHTCQICGNNECILVAHHLESYATSPILRLDPDNGITLCKSCHWDFHARYGKSGNTRQQFMEYVATVRRIR